MLPYFSAVNIEFCDLLPKRVVELFLELELRPKSGKVPNGLLIILDEIADIRTRLGFG